MKHRGLGDTIKMITKSTGVDYIVKAASKALDVDCGCDKRQESLNKKVPYKKK
jgi:hypothetical protein